MTDHNDAPDEHTPEGAIPTADDAPEPSRSLTGDLLDAPHPETMIGEGEPLPVGAHDPSIEQPHADPPGMPKAPDDLDRVLADYVNARHNDETGRFNHGVPVRDRFSEVRPDQATLDDAMTERILDFSYVGDVRAALLMQVQHARARQREMARKWADAVREREEARDAFEHYTAKVDEAVEAMRTLGLLRDEEVDGDFEPKAKPVSIPDAFIV